VYTTADASRFAYNDGLRRKQEAYNAGCKSLSAIDLHREINLLKQEHPWMYDVSKCAFQEALCDLDTAFGHFFRTCNRKKQEQWKGTCSYPLFNSRKKGIGGARFSGSITVSEDAIRLPRLGVLRLKERGYLLVNMKIGSATISENAGRW
jgi:putative transposase